MVKRTGRPGYLQIADDLRQQISDGRLSPGQSLPSTARLRERYDVSAGVVKAAISVLRTEGLVIGQQGKGVFVRDVPIEPAEKAEGASPGVSAEVLEQLAQLRESVKEMGDRLAALEAAVFQQQK